MDSHQYASLFPELTGPEFDQLVTDIKAYGQRDPIMLYKNQILDGRSRWRACQKAGVKPVTEVYRGSDPLAFVLSRNIHRRHLTAKQRAAIVVKAAKLSGELARLKAEAESREARPGQPRTEASREASKGKTAAQLAASAKVSRATVERVQQAAKTDPKALDKIAAGATTSRKVTARRRTSLEVVQAETLEDVNRFAKLLREMKEEDYREMWTPAILEALANVRTLLDELVSIAPLPSPLPGSRAAVPGAPSPLPVAEGA